MQIRTVQGISAKNIKDILEWTNSRGEEFFKTVGRKGVEVSADRAANFGGTGSDLFHFGWRKLFGNNTNSA